MGVAARRCIGPRTVLPRLRLLELLFSATQVAQRLLAVSAAENVKVKRAQAGSACATVGDMMARRATIALGILLAWCTCAFALDPALDISQYAHTAWKIREGFSKGRVTSFAQTPDGYLWLGTEFGLLRFDGVRNVPWDPPAGEHLPSSYIRSMIAAHDGRLWIGTYKGLASWNDGKLTKYRELAGQTIDVLLETEMTVVLACGWHLCMKIDEATFGRERRPGCGDGSLVLRNSTRCKTRSLAPPPRL